MSEPDSNKPTPGNPESPKCPQCGTPLPAGALGGLCPACLLKQGASGDTAAPESVPFVPPSIAEIARLFPQLEILRLLGAGGMGAVYQARQPSLDRMIALKVLPVQSADTGFAERFTREARALARLSHPNIVTVHEFGQVEGLHYFIMEMVEGVNLRQLQMSGRLSSREALQIVPQLCDALQYAHDQGVVHRDIKPANVLVDRKGRVKIADFGLAKIVGQESGEARLTGVGMVMGTPHYMSPEQVEHPLDVDHRADIYSLGVVFYEMLTGELPLGRFAPPSSKVQIDVRLDEVVLRALEKEPSRRYQHASQVKSDVENIGSTVGPPPTPNADDLADQIVARDYQLNIGHCLSRAWSLVIGDFWPLVGVNTLVLVLLAAVGSLGNTISFSTGKNGPSGSLSVLGFLVSGPLMGGLYLYFLKKIRRERTSIETVFSGFSNRFLHLFLGGLVTYLLMGVGFVCCILPGVYLLVAWMFTLILIADKRLDFWPAMELSRRVITKHWWKFLGLGIVMVLVGFLGLLACLVGFLVASPIIVAALLYAYEDIFGVTRPAAAPSAPAQPASGSSPSGPAAPFGASGPFGTSVMPGAPAKPGPAGSGGGWKVVAGIVGVLVLLVLIIGGTVAGIVTTVKHHRRAADRIAEVERAVARKEATAARRAEAAARGLPKTDEANWDFPDATPFDSAQTVNDVPPVVVRTEPASGADDVPPGETEIKVTFSKEMADNAWSWGTAWENSIPENIGDPSYSDDHTTCVQKVKLEPGKTYAYWLNSDQFKNFADRDNHPAVPYLLIFSTRAATNSQ